MLYKNIQIGNKHVAVKSFNYDKIIISLILTIFSNGNKLAPLAPLVIFKGKQMVL